MSIPWIYHDGGRAAAGFNGKAGDCVTRAIAIAADQDYRLVYDWLAWGEKSAGRPRSARNGIHREVYDWYLKSIGFTWVPVMGIGTGCTMHLTGEEVPMGWIIVRLSRHLSAVIDGVVYDTFDPSRGGKRCVYGYWEAP